MSDQNKIIEQQERANYYLNNQNLKVNLMWALFTVLKIL